MDELNRVLGRLTLGRTLHARFLIALALIGILPLGLVGLGGAAWQRQVIAEQSARELTGLARGVAGGLDASLGPGHLADMRAMATLPEIVSMDPARQDRMLKELLLAYQQFALLSTFDSSGLLLASSHPDSAAPASLLRSFQIAASQGVQSWEVGPSPSTRRLSLLLYVPIRNPQREVVGVLSGVVDMGSLSMLVGPVPVGDGGRAFVLDSDGRTLIHTNADAVRQRRDYSWIGLPNGGRPFTPGTVRYVFDGEARIAGYAPVPSTGWTAVVEQPEASVLAPAERAWQLALAGLGLSACLALVAAALLARRLTAALSDLAFASRALGMGDHRAPIPRSPADTQELASLEEAFASMRDAVIQRETALRDETRVVETLYSIGRAVAAELDLEKLVQSVTDAATEVTGAEFGAFFYNVVDELHEESYTLYTISGVRREAFDLFSMPRNTPLFGHTFRGEGVLRLDDVTADPRYGKMPPHYGIPKGHLPVRSFLAVPVISRSGEVLGGIFLGHQKPGIFSERAERLAVGIAAQAAIAVDNARLYAQAQAGIRARDQLLSVASHELKTPVTRIKIGAQLLMRARARGGLDEERVERTLSIMDDTADRLSALIDDLLDVSRIHLGQLSLQVALVDLRGLVTDVAARYQEQLGDRHQVVLEQSVEDGSLLADGPRLEQVLTNLLDNAIKYSPEGGVLHLEMLPDGNGILIQVRDQGIGLPEGSAERIFEPFGRAPNAAERQLPGLGLGLYICRNIVESHGGWIRAESPGEGQGTTISFWLPATPATTEKPAESGVNVDA
jgi:signal transduction histidine kinase